jgi:hypothetical protein
VLLVIVWLLSVVVSFPLAGTRYRVDERARRVTVTGIGWPPWAISDPVQARLMAERAVIVDAYGVAGRLLGPALSGMAQQTGASTTFLRGGRVTRIDAARDGSVEVELEVPIDTHLAERLM